MITHSSKKIYIIGSNPDEFFDLTVEAVNIFSQSDIIIFSVPVSQIDSCLDEAKNFFNTEKVFSDTLSSKKLILDYFKVNNLNNIFVYILSCLT